MQKNEYIESVKDELEGILGQENYDYYEKCYSKQDIKLYVECLCDNLKDFDGDIWELAEVVAATIFEVYHQNLPGSGLAAYLIVKIFKHGVAYICEEYTA